MVMSGDPATDLGWGAGRRWPRFFITPCCWLRSNLTYGELLGIAVHSRLLPELMMAVTGRAPAMWLRAVIHSRWQPLFF